MYKWYANITLEDGDQITIGEYSERALELTLIQAMKQGLDLSKASVNISRIEISEG